MEWTVMTLWKKLTHILQHRVKNNCMVNQQKLENEIKLRNAGHNSDQHFLTMILQNNC